ncbi:hypothetical protein GCM10010294_30080 [Streptomyces griseoloalbus]|uniref:hypothetical protein n=1 Tax=Streptomyces griseoloalbus TaxID=67303 RepID=UPI0018773CED|nr:hypothetical protein GCM10010294_30080 [Streptomyces griseoloalbus]
MSEESVPRRGGAAGGPPTGLLQRMEELMAALNADLSALDADLRAAGPGRDGGAGATGSVGAVGAGTAAAVGTVEVGAVGAGDAREGR